MLAPDHPRLLSIIAGACTVAGANIVDAQIFTTTDGRALDSISIHREFDDEADEQRRARRVGDLIEQALSGAVRLPEVIAAQERSAGRASVPSRWRPRSRSTTPRRTASPSSRLPGSTGRASSTTSPGSISDLNLNIASAHIATFGERAVDVFYVTDLVGHKIANGNREAAIRRRLRAAFDGEAGKAEPPPRPSEARAGVGSGAPCRS